MAASRGWEKGREGGGGGEAITFPEHQETNDKNLVYVVSHIDELEVNVKKVSAILDQIASFKRSPTHGRPGGKGYVVEYARKGSLALATDFAVEGIRFAPRNPTSLCKLREELLREELNPDVAEEDREFSAILSAGTKFGSRRQLDLIHQAENVLMDKAYGRSMEQWQ